MHSSLLLQAGDLAQQVLVVCLLLSSPVPLLSPMEFLGETVFMLSAQINLRSVVVQKGYSELQNKSISVSGPSNCVSLEIPERHPSEVARRPAGFILATLLAPKC